MPMNLGRSLRTSPSTTMRAGMTQDDRVFTEILTKNIRAYRLLEKSIDREEAKHPPTPKNVKGLISLIREAEEKNDGNKVRISDSIKEHDESNVGMPLKEAEKENEDENGTKNELTKSAEKKFTQAEKEEVVEPPTSQPVGYYLKHKINEKLIEGLVNTGSTKLSRGSTEVSFGRVAVLYDDEESNHEDASDTGDAPKQQQQYIDNEVLEGMLKNILAGMSISQGNNLRGFLECVDAKRFWEAIRTRFGGNANSKKMQKAVFKQQFEAFKISSSEGYQLRMQILKFLRFYAAAMVQIWQGYCELNKRFADEVNLFLLCKQSEDWDCFMKIWKQIDDVCRPLEEDGHKLADSDD
ncbi:hypothetical protein Tco_0318032 [Tanacetum coccineum]